MRASMRLPLSLVVVVVICASFVSAGSLSRSGLLPVRIASANTATDLLASTSAAYSIDNALRVSVDSYSSPVVLNDAFMANSDYDIATSDTAFTTAQSQATPQYVAYPLVGNAIVPIYNLPGVLSKLILPVEVICAIELGDITNWNDTAIQAANPSSVMPDLGIYVHHFLDETAIVSDAVTSLCGKVSSGFAAAIPRSYQPVFPIARYFAHARGVTSDVIASMVDEQVGSYAMVTFGNAATIQAKVASVRNTVGEVLDATLNSISLNLLELAAAPLAPGEWNYDLTNPRSPNAWPVCTLIYLWVDTVYPLSTCATKASVLEYVLYLYSDASVKVIADSLHMAMVPDLYVTKTDLLARLQAQVTCQGSALISSSSTVGYISGFAGMSRFVSAISNYYRAAESRYTFTFASATEKLATQRVVANEIDIAVVNSRQLAATDVALMTSESAGIFIPALYTGVAVTYILPTDMATKVAVWSASTSLLPSLLPLALDMETIAKIFVGAITDWLDPAILALNPQLQAWFDDTPTARSNFSTIACCDNTADPRVASQLLMQGLNGTVVAQSKQYKSLFEMPVSFAQQQKASSRFNILDKEVRMTPKLTTEQNIGGSSISYRLISTGATDPTSEFLIMQTVAGVTERIAPEPANFQQCAQVGWDLGRLNDPGYIPAPIASCYPLSSVISFGINLVYTGSDCTRGNRSLNLFNWITNTRALSGAALQAGVLLLADLTAIREYTTTVLNTGTCDGETLLITLPTVWTVNSAIQGFGTAVLVIGLVLFAASGVILVLYRKRSVLRSSSVPFLGLVLLGLAMLVVSVAAWSVKVSAGSCGLFVWFGSLGFSLVFVPFFAKTYRIYVIFSRQKLKVVKMSNEKLMGAVGALIAAEIILLISWSQLSPLKPITYLRNIGGTFHQAEHCSVDGQGMTFVVIETVYKAMLLIAGTMLAFSTRKVSTAFNESSAIAFAIYNVLFSSVIVGGIIYFVNAFEDTLILLFLFLIFWVTFATWGLMFGQKFYVMFSESEEDAAVMSKMSSLQTEKSAGFSFVSVINMPANMIKGYVIALEGQLAKARKQLTVVLGTTGQGIGIGIGAGVGRADRESGGTNKFNSQRARNHSSIGDETDVLSQDGIASSSSSPLMANLASPTDVTSRPKRTPLRVSSSTVPSPMTLPARGAVSPSLDMAATPLSPDGGVSTYLSEGVGGPPSLLLSPEAESMTAAAAPSQLVLSPTESSAGVQGRSASPHFIVNMSTAARPSSRALQSQIK